MENTQPLTLLRERQIQLQGAVDAFHRKHGVNIDGVNFGPHNAGNTHHYQHIYGNLVFALSVGISALEETVQLKKEPDEELLTLVTGAADDLALYLDLLERHPDYRAAEFRHPNGFFPDLNEHERYVKASAERLTQKP